VHNSERVTFTWWWLLQTQAAGWVGAFQSKQGSTTPRCSAPLCIASTSKSHGLKMKLYFKPVPKRCFRTFCLYFSIPFLPVTITEGGDMPPALILPKPHGSSIFLTTFIDSLMGPPLLNMRTKTSYLLACVTDGQKPALISHSRPTSTFYMTQHMLFLVTRSDHTG